MEKKAGIKPNGIVLIKGVNEKSYRKHIAKLKPIKEQVMVSIVKNRW